MVPATNKHSVYIKIFSLFFSLKNDCTYEIISFNLSALGVIIVLNKKLNVLIVNSQFPFQLTKVSN